LTAKNTKVEAKITKLQAGVTKALTSLKTEKTAIGTTEKLKKKEEDTIKADDKIVYKDIKTLNKTKHKMKGLLDKFETQSFESSLVSGAKTTFPPVDEAYIKKTKPVIEKINTAVSSGWETLTGKLLAQSRILQNNAQKAISVNN